MSDISEYKVLDSKDEHVQRQERLQSLCWEIFEKNKMGKELLKLLSEEFILRAPVIDPNLVKVYGDHAVGIREGQNHILRMFQANIDSYKLKLRSEK